MIGFLRVGAVCGLVLSIEPYMGLRLASAPFGLSPVLWHSAVLSLVFIAYTVIDAMFTAALGVGGSVSTQNPSVVGGVVFSARFMAIVLFGWWVFSIYQRLQMGQDYIPIALFGLGGFGLLTWGALRVGEWWAVQGQVSEPV
jgi:hypothetical protein